MKRLATALVLIPIAVYGTLFAPEGVFVAIVALIALLCFREYAQMSEAFAPVGFVAGLLILISPPGMVWLFLLLGTLAAMCLPLAAGATERSIVRASALVLGIIYIFGSWKAGIQLHAQFPAAAGFGVAAGRHWMMFGLVTNWIGDTGAYYIGKNFGRNKLAPLVSPGKTWEGAAASLVASLIFGIGYLWLAIPSTPIVTILVVAVATNIAGQVGDLAESAIKRGAGVKDSGTLLPGHGGFLDRVDSSLFALPVLYTLLSFLPSH